MQKDKINVYLAGKINSDKDVQWRARIFFGDPDPEKLIEFEDYNGDCCYPEYKQFEEIPTIYPNIYCCGPFWMDHCGMFRDYNETIIPRCFEAIDQSDIIFAWISDEFSSGTYVELGYARGKNKKILIASSLLLPTDATNWLFGIADCYLMRQSEPKKAFEQLMREAGINLKVDKKITYFIKNGDFVKIGQSNDPEGRLKQLQTASHKPLELIFICYFEENELHQKFWKYHKEGEWFFYSNEIKKFLEDQK